MWMVFTPIASMHCKENAAVKPPAGNLIGDTPLGYG
jgi:hypothetical protein